MKTTTLILAAMLYSISGTSQMMKEPAQHQESNETPEVIEPKNDISGSIVDDLLKMKLITTKENVSFILTSEKFEVNDTLQSEEIFQKFKKKYHIVKGYTIKYSKSGGSTSTSTTIVK